ncbi:SGT1 and CS domain protein [Penicillium brasilianum]|uniref:SGT1 and CS domain protein n=1 Tax=Penicillium brasilianum TaxID=104259 RepID=A0A1S9RTN0_PENBI|nr:SGT1 and CS domain protein [Penicillium brasilianum]
MNAAAEGDKALAASNAPLAIQHYTRALIELPRAPSYYLQRAIARSRVKPADGGPNSRDALQDAEIALSLARERGKRELILSAQMRRGVALFQLERYGDAKFLFELIESKTSGEKELQNKAEGVKAAMADGGSKKNGYGAELPIWMAKVRRKLGELSEGDEKGTVSVVEFPTDTRVPTEKQLKAEWESLKAGKTVDGGDKTVPDKGQKDSSSSGISSDKTKSETKAAEASPVVAAQKVRHEWYQSNDSVVVTLYAKGIPKESVETELKDDSVSLQFPLPSGSGYDFTLDPLYAPIDPSASKFSVMGTKIELVLQKKTPGQKWKSLEGSASNTTKIADRPAAPQAPVSSGPSYPTSSRHGAKDWDKVASSLTAKKSKETNEKTKKDDTGDVSDAESVDSEFGGDAVDGFFKKLYAGADPDTRRAMMKSYVESQGTSLSTNWSEVGNKKMEPHPPS